MSKLPNPLARALERQRPELQPAPVRKIPNATAIPSRRGKIGQTIHIPEDAHRLLKEICREHEVEEKTIQSLLREGLNLVLQLYGKKPVA